MDFTRSTNILIVTPLPEEHDVLLEEMPSTYDLSTATRVASLHEYGVRDHNVVSILPIGMGQDDAFDAAQEAIEKFQPDMVICVGIAGGLDTDLKIGDVAVSQEIIDISQNMKISTGKRARGEKVQLSPRSLSVDERISAGCRFVRSHPNLRPKYTKWQEEAKLRRASLASDYKAGDIEAELEIEPAILTGAIVSGPVVASAAFKETIKGLDRKAIAIETEAAGIHKACSKKQIPFVTIRGISDHADCAKNALERTSKSSFRRLAAANAVSYLKMQLANPSFLRAATYHASFRRYGKGPIAAQNSASEILENVSNGIHEYLCQMSPEYKHRPTGATLPVPRVMRMLEEEDILDEGDDREPVAVSAALARDFRVTLKIPKSYPNQTLSWSIAQSLLSCEIEGKTVLPLVIDGNELNPPSKGFMHAANFNFWMM